MLSGHYDLRLVAISVLIAIIASYAALDLAARVQQGERAHFKWLSFGAVAMGAGVWAMHYIGMTAYELPVPVLYDLPTVVLSFLAAILASGGALWIVSRPPLTTTHSLVGSIVMGGGIASMHYIGMAAMRLPAMCVYSPPLVVLSVFLAILISYTALRLLVLFRGDAPMPPWWKAGAAVLLGLAIPVMHYVGMTAVSFVAMPQVDGNVAHAVRVTSLGLLSVCSITLTMLAIVILQASNGRQIAFRELEIAKSRMQTQVIFDSLREGIVVLDLNRKIVQINNSAKLMLGLPDPQRDYKDIAGTFSLHLPSGDPLPDDVWPSALALRGEFLQNYELHIKRTDTGESIVSEVSTAPIRDQDGRMTQIIVSHRDVTQPREIDEARVRLAAIVESSEDAIIGKDHEGIVTTWNKGAEKLFGYTSQEMVGHSIRILLPIDRLHEEDEILARIRKGETVDHIETIRRRKNGQFINVSLTISPIRDGAGRIVGASKIVRNITERKIMEGRLYQSQKMEAIGQLTGGIAHDFNNLLGVVIGNLDLLERRVAEDDTSRKRVQTALRAATRGAELTKRLLAFSSREQLHPDLVRLEVSIKATLDLASRGIGPEVTIVTCLDHAVPPVMVDCGGLENALLNILVNARDAMPRGGQITITTEQTLFIESHEKVRVEGLHPGGYAVITISDTGEGMSREVLQRVFEPFYTTKERDKGTGLGLAMVYGFFKQSGGAIRMYSEPGYGTTVSCYLPLAEDGAKATSPSTISMENPVVPTGGTILLVDDEIDLLEIASAYIQELGYVVLCARSGTDGLALVQAHPEISVIVTDVIMAGGLNGAELAQQARHLRPDLKIIYTSGFPADALAERKMSFADGPLLRKPYQRAELVSLITEALRSRFASETAHREM